MNIVNFLKSLVLPRTIVKYRSMSALVAVMIFVLSIYVIALPFGKINAKAAAGLKDDYAFYPLQNIENSTENLAKLKEISDLGFSVNADGKLVSTSPTIVEDNVYEWVLTSVSEGITKNVHIIIDYNKIDTIETLTPHTLEEYPYVENQEDYFVTMNRDYIFYQAFQIGLESKEPLINHNGEDLIPTGTQSFDYKTYMPTFTLVRADDQVSTLGNYLLDQLLLAQAKFNESISSFNAFLLVFIYPLFMVVIFWLFFRRQGRLHRFKEYYNVASITSIVPTLLAFGLSWLFPVVLDYYIFGFAIYYLFVLYRINSMPEEI